jgi:peptidoglycan/LPS O-acetylase OafA/YrhL
MRNIPALDGLRAVSIALVIGSHLHNAATSDKTYTSAILANGDLGVTVFFVISGYLITHLLLREFDRDGALNLRDFYVRRAFRILPPYYLYLLVVCIAATLGFLPVTRIQAASAFLFLWDYFPKIKAWPLEHLWSLSVEEQFYILWPISLVACLRRSRRSAQHLALACLVVAPALRVLAHFTSPYYSTQIYYMLHTRMDSLMFGCLTALSQNEPWFETTYRRMARYVYPMIGFVLVISPMLTHRFGGAYIFTVGYSAEGLCIAIAMLWLVRNPTSYLGAALNWGPIKRIGVMSYSLYIWQTLFLHRENRSFLGRFPINLVAIFACATFSYFVIEGPSLRLRERFISRRPLTGAVRNVSGTS